MLPDLSRRNRQPERMDRLDLDPAEHRRALAGLARIHRVCRTEARLWKQVLELVRSRPGGRLRVLDLACGGGDLAAGLAHRAHRADLSVEVAGCDRSPVAIEAAKGVARRRGVEIELLERDVLTEDIPEGYDLITCGLFLHHLDEEGAVRLLSRLGAAARALWVQDLVRSPLGWIYAWAGSRLLTRSSTVHVDALLSVRAAFTAQEAVALVGRAGLEGARVEQQWPQRWVMTWRSS